ACRSRSQAAHGRRDTLVARPRAAAVAVLSGYERSVRTTMIRAPTPGAANMALTGQPTRMGASAATAATSAHAGRGAEPEGRKMRPGRVTPRAGKANAREPGPSGPIPRRLLKAAVYRPAAYPCMPRGLAAALR